MKHKGFTLIELVIVIIILGILAATAVPRFIDLQTDAKQARLEGMKAAIESAIDITYAKIAIEGLEDKEGLNSSTPGHEIYFSIPGCGNVPEGVGARTFCEFSFGYPDAYFGTLPVLVESIDNTPGEGEWSLGGHTEPETVSGEGVRRGIKIALSSNVNADTTLKEDNCYIYYRNWMSREAGKTPPPRPTVEIVACE